MSCLASQRSEARRRLSRRLLGVVALLASLLVAAQATPSPTFANLTISFWPEYDQSAMLVIYDATLSADVPLPVDVRLPLPAGVSDVNAVAQGDANNQLVDAPHQLSTENGVTTVTLQATSRTVRVEFYQALTIQGTTRHYQFVWPGGVSIGSLSANVQHPVGATGLTTEPAADGQVIGPDGLPYSRLSLGAIQATDQPSISISYDKSDSTLTATTLAQATTVASAGTTGGASSGGATVPDQTIFWAALFIGVVLIAGAVVWYMRILRKPRDRSGSSARRHRPKNRTVSAETSDSELGAAVFCHQCGTQADPSDRFCRRCGTRLRT